MLVHFYCDDYFENKISFAQKFILKKRNWKMCLKKKMDFFPSLFSFRPFGPVSPRPPSFSPSWAVAQPATPLPSLSLPLADKRAPLVSSFPSKPSPPSPLSLPQWNRKLFPLLPRSPDAPRLGCLEEPAREPSPSFPISFFRAFASALARREPPPEPSVGRELPRRFEPSPPFLSHW